MAWPRTLLCATAAVALIFPVACGSERPDELAPSVTDAAVTALEPTTTPPRTTTSQARPTTTVADVRPWESAPPPAPPPLTPSPGFEALADVDSVCVQVTVDWLTRDPGGVIVTKVLESLGYRVLETGCDFAVTSAVHATLSVSLAGTADPVGYSGGLTCYLDKSVTGTVELSVAGAPLGTWTVDAISNAPLVVSQNQCPSQYDLVDVSYWTHPALWRVLYDALGNVGLAAASANSWNASTLGPTFKLMDSDEQRDAFLADPQVKVLLASMYGSEPLTSFQVALLADFSEEMAVRQILAPAGLDVLVPHLLRTVTADAELLSDSDLDTAWHLLQWISGVSGRYPAAVWEWYESTRP